MQVKFFVLFLICFFITNSYSALSPLSCSKNGSYLIFINGVRVGDEDFQEFFSIVEKFASGYNSSAIVKIYGNVTNWFFNIADNTTVYGPITLGCDVSGIIYSDYECP